MNGGPLVRSSSQRWCVAVHPVVSSVNSHVCGETRKRPAESVRAEVSMSACLQIVFHDRPMSLKGCDEILSLEYQGFGETRESNEPRSFLRIRMKFPISAQIWVQFWKSRLLCGSQAGLPHGIGCPSTSVAASPPSMPCSAAHSGSHDRGYACRPTVSFPLDRLHHPLL